MNIISRIANQSAIDFYQIDGDRLLAGPTSSPAPRRTTKNGPSSAMETLVRGFYSTTKLPGGKGSTGSIPAVAWTQADVVVNPPRSPAKRSLNEPTIRFDEYRINLRAEMFKFCLVGKFPAAVAGPSLEQVKEMASGEWNLQGNCSITLLDQSHLFIRLESEADMIRVWPRNEWRVDGQVMKVFKWTPMFRPTDGELPSAAVWVSLPSLPVVFYQEDLLYQIVSLVGKVLGVDDGTRNLTRTDSARVCVEVDLLKELPSRVWIEIGTKGFWQAIQYEELPCFCTNCSTVGHKTISCKKKMEKVAIDASGVGTSRFETKNCDARVGYCHSCPLNGEIERLHSLKGSAAILDEERNTVAGIKIELGSNQDVVGCSSGQVLERVGGKTVKEVSQENKRRRTKPVVTKEELPEIVEVGEMHSSKEQGEKEMASRELASRTQNLDKDHHNAGSSQGKQPMRGSHTASKQNFWERHQSPERPSALSFSIRRFSFEEMKVATKCFKEKIGEGGFGRVYKGKLGNDLVAIKRWSSDSIQGPKEFEREVRAFVRLGHHWHLVSLVGFCNENDELLLAYEYMSHGDLSKHLFDGSNTRPLSWAQRLKICIGVARGLHHLHLNKIIHRDVKPRNILVDHNWEAKLTDLGISKVAMLIDKGVTHLSTRIMGTYGYGEPHYLLTGQLTYESDVYSFGVVMLEVLFGRPVIDAGGQANLETWRKSCRRKKIAHADIDAHLKVAGAELRSMAGAMKYEIRQPAYVKLVLHALKHPSSTVNGILVGRLSAAGDSPVVLVDDAVPLSHSLLPLLPTLEIALLQVEEYFQADGLGVVGYYQANERYDDGELGGVAKRIGDHIAQHFPLAALLLLDNKKVEALQKGGSGSPAVQLFTKDASKNWRHGDVGTQLTFKDPSANVVLLDYIATKKWQQIVDFDDHLDDISKDWLNSDLFK